MKSSKAFYEEGANMNKIFKVVWSKVRNTYVVVSEIAKNTVSGVGKRNRVGKVSFAATLAASVLTSGFFMPNEVWADGAMEPYKPYNYIAIGAKNSWGTIVNPFEDMGFDIQGPSNGERYIEVTLENGEIIKYVLTKIDKEGNVNSSNDDVYYWIRDGFGVKAITHAYHPSASNLTLDLYKIPGRDANYDKLAMMGEHSAIITDKKTAVNRVNLDELQYRQYAGMTNSASMDIQKHYSYYIKRGEQYINVGGNGILTPTGNNINDDFYVFKSDEYNPKTGKWTFAGQDVDYDDVYQLDGKLGVFLTGSYAGAYTDTSLRSGALAERGIGVYGGSVYGKNNEILLSGYDSSSDTWTTVWGGEITDPNATIETMTLNEFNEILHHIHEENVKLNDADVVRTVISPNVDTGVNLKSTSTSPDASITGVTGGGSINLVNVAGNRVPGLLVTSSGGTGGVDTEITFKDSNPIESTVDGVTTVTQGERAYFTLKTGSVVKANENLGQYKEGEDNPLQTLTINGRLYTVGEYTTGTDTEISEIQVAAGENVEVTSQPVNGIRVYTVNANDTRYEVLEGVTNSDGSVEYAVKKIDKDNPTGVTIRTIIDRDTDTTYTFASREGANGATDYVVTNNNTRQEIAVISDTDTVNSSVALIYNDESKKLTVSVTDSAGTTITDNVGVDLSSLVGSSGGTGSGSDKYLIGTGADNKDKYNVTNGKVELNIANSNDKVVIDGIASHSELADVEQAVSNGWVAKINNDINVKRITPLDNSLNFVSGSNVHLENENGSIKISATDTNTVTNLVAGTNVTFDDNDPDVDANGNKTYTINATNNYVKGASVSNSTTDDKVILTLEQEGLADIVIDDLKNTYTTNVTVTGNDNNASVQFRRNNNTSYEVNFTSGGGITTNGIAEDTYLQISDGTNNVKLNTGSKVVANGSEEVTDGALTQLSVNGKVYSVATSSSVAAAKTVVVAGENVKVTTDVKNNNGEDGHTEYTINAFKTVVNGDSNFVVGTPLTDEINHTITYGLGLANTVTIGDSTGKPIVINGVNGIITGLQNKTWDSASIVSGRAATEDQLKLASIKNGNIAGYTYGTDGNGKNITGTSSITLSNADGTEILTLDGLKDTTLVAGTAMKTTSSSNYENSYEVVDTQGNTVVIDDVASAEKVGVLDARVGNAVFTGTNYANSANSVTQAIVAVDSKVKEVWDDTVVSGSVNHDTGKIVLTTNGGGTVEVDKLRDYAIKDEDVVVNGDKAILTVKDRYSDASYDVKITGIASTSALESAETQINNQITNITNGSAIKFNTIGSDKLGLVNASGSNLSSVTITSQEGTGGLVGVVNGAKDATITFTGTDASNPVVVSVGSTVSGTLIDGVLTAIEINGENYGLFTASDQKLSVSGNQHGWTLTDSSDNGVYKDTTLSRETTVKSGDATNGYSFTVADTAGTSITVNDIASASNLNSLKTVVDGHTTNIADLSSSINTINTSVANNYSTLSGNDIERMVVTPNSGTGGTVALLRNSQTNGVNDIVPGTLTFASGGGKDAGHPDTFVTISDGSNSIKLNTGSKVVAIQHMDTVDDNTQIGSTVNDFHWGGYIEGIAINGKAYGLGASGSSSSLEHDYHLVMAEYKNETDTPNAVNLSQKFGEATYGINANAYKADGNGVIKLNVLNNHDESDTSTLPKYHNVYLADVASKEIQEELQADSIKNIVVGINGTIGLNRVGTNGIAEPVDGTVTVTAIEGSSTTSDAQLKFSNIINGSETAFTVNVGSTVRANDAVLSSNTYLEKLSVNGTPYKIFTPNDINASFVAGVNNLKVDDAIYTDATGAKHGWKITDSNPSDSSQGSVVYRDTTLDSTLTKVTTENGARTLTVADTAGHSVVLNDIASASEVNQRFDNIEGNITNIQGDISNLTTDVTNIRGVISNLTTDVSNIRNDITNITGNQITSGSIADYSYDSQNGGSSSITLVTEDVNDNDIVLQGLKDTTLRAGTINAVETKDSDGKLTNRTYTFSDTNNNEVVLNDVASASKLETVESKVEENTTKIEEHKTDISNLYTNDQIISQTISNSNQYLDSRINQVNSRVNKVGAGAAALAALHPMDFDPDDKLSFAVGAGNYAGETATALGAFYRPNEKVMMNVAGTYGNGENMVNVGMSFALDRTNNVSNSRTAMAKEIVDLREQVATQGQQIAQLVALVQQLAGVQQPIVPAEQLFPDVPQNHWAYEYVNGLIAKGIIEGYPDGTFGGDRAMTRYEFAAMLFRAMEQGVVINEQVRQEFEPELGRIRVDRVKGTDADLNKIERVRVNTAIDHDDYGSKVVQVKH